MVEEHKRAFKGVWMPATILMNPNLTHAEKILMVHINSLDCEERGGCYATNKYLAMCVQLHELSVSRSISKLKSMGYIEDVSTDPTQRLLRVTPLAFGFENTTITANNEDKKVDDLRGTQNVNTLNNLLTPPKQFVNPTLTNCLPNNITNNKINNTSSYTNVYSEVGCERAPAVPAEPASPIKDTTASGATPLFTRQRKKSSAQFLVEKERAKSAQTSNEEKERTCAGVGVQARRQAGTREAVAAVAAPNERGASRETAMRNNLAKRFVEYCGAKWQRDLMSEELKEFGQKLFDWIYSCAHTYKFKMDEPVAKSLWAELDRYKQQYGVGTLMKVLQKATSQATRIYPTMFYEFTSSNSTRRERRFNDEDTTTQQITPDTKTSNIY